MGNMLKWAEEVKRANPKNQRKEILEYVCKKIFESMLIESDSIDDCVKALCYFEPIAFDVFYKNWYRKLPEKTQENWDAAFLKWADNWSHKKNAPSATPRIRFVIQHKLIWSESVNGVIKELKWLSLNFDKEDKRTVTAYLELRKKCKDNDLRKLLDLDMSGWTAGQRGIHNIFSLLFEGNTNPETKKQYEEFKKQNSEFISVARISDGELQKALVQEDAGVQRTKNLGQEPKDPEATEQESKFDQDFFSQLKGPQRSDEKVQPESEKVQSQGEGMQGKPISETPTEEQKSHSQGESERKEAEKKLPESTEKQNGTAESETVVSAEFVKQIEEQKSKIIQQEVKITELFRITNAQKVQIELQANRINELKKNCTAAETQVKELSEELSAEKEKSQLLQIENEKDKSIIAQLHKMTDNSIRQELDGFKEKLRQAMASIVKDFREEYEENEKAEVYEALLEDLMYILKINDLLVEEK